MGTPVAIVEPLQALAGHLISVGLNAAVSISDVKTPGVWVNPTGISLDRLGGHSVTVNLVCIAEDSDTIAVLSALETLANDVLAVLDAHDDPTFVTIQPEWSASPVPALVIPHTLLVDYPTT